MGICLGICSGKGGTGKSTVTTALSFCLSQKGKSVICVDLDEGLRCLDIMFGIDDKITLDLADILAGRPPIDAIYPIADTNISLIPAPLEYAKNDYSKLGNLITALKHNYDYVIVDLPAGINPRLTRFIASATTQFITVCNPDPVSIKDAAVMAKSLPRCPTAPRLIINSFNYELVKDGIYCNIDDMIDMSETQLLGIIPYSLELMLISVNHKLKIGSKAHRAASRIASRILGEKVALPNPKKI